MIVFAIAGLGFMALVAVGFALDPNGVFKNVGEDPAQKVGAYGFFVAYFTLGLLTRVLQLLGAIAMLRGRGYRLAGETRRRRRLAARCLRRQPRRLLRSPCCRD